MEGSWFMTHSAQTEKTALRGSKNRSAFGALCYLCLSFPVRGNTGRPQRLLCRDLWPPERKAASTGVTTAPFARNGLTAALACCHHKIDPAAVCSSQHQTGNYRKEGGGLMCLTDDGSQSESKTVDLADYCRRNHGEAAIVSRRLADNRPLCTVKGDGGLSQTHHAIDTAALCGGGGGSVDGDTLDCNAAPGAGQKAASDADNQPGKPEKQANQPGGEPRNGSDGGSAGTAGDVRIYSRSELAEMDLSDCGFIQASEDMQQNMINARKAAKDENGRGGFGWEYGGVDTPCTALGTGLVSDLDAFCLYSKSRLRPAAFAWLHHKRAADVSWARR